MKLLWECPLPIGDPGRDYEFDGPILTHGGQVCYAGYSDPDARYPSFGEFEVRLHRIDRETGTGAWTDFAVFDPGLPGSWSLTTVRVQVWFHCGALIHAADPPERQASIPEGTLIPEKLTGRSASPVIGGRLCIPSRSTATASTPSPGPTRTVYPASRVSAWSALQS